MVNWGKRRFFVLPWRSLPRSFSFDFTVARAPRCLTAPALSSNLTTINYQLLAINQPALRPWREIPCCTDCARAPRYRRQPGLVAAGPRAGPLAVDTELPNPASGGKGLGTFSLKTSKPWDFFPQNFQTLELFLSKFPNIGTFPFKISKPWNFLPQKLPNLGTFCSKTSNAWNFCLPQGLCRSSGVLCNLSPLCSLFSVLSVFSVVTISFICNLRFSMLRWQQSAIHAQAHHDPQRARPPVLYARSQRAAVRGQKSEAGGQRAAVPPYCFESGYHICGPPSTEQAMPVEAMQRRPSAPRVELPA